MTTSVKIDIFNCAIDYKLVACLLCSVAVFGVIPLYGNVFLTYVPPQQCTKWATLDIDVRNETRITNFTRKPNISSEGELNVKLACYTHNGSGNTADDQFMSNSSTCENWKFLKPVSVESISTEFLLVCENSWLTPMLTSSQMLGFMVGSVLGGTLADRLGRRPVYLSSIFLQATSLISLSLIHNLIASYVLMFLCGFGMIIRGIVGMVILNELVPNNHRKAVGILAVLSESLSAILTPLLAWLLPNWRWMIGANSAALFLVFIPIVMFVRESTKWLNQTYNHKNAEGLKKQTKKINEETKLDSNCDCEVVTLSSEEGSIKPKLKKYNYLDLVKVDFIRRRFCILSFAWFAADMAFYGLTFNTNNLGGNRYINSFLSGAVEFPAQFLCFLAVGRIGCRRSFMTSTVLTSVCLVLTPFIQQVNVWVGVITAMLGKLAITVGYTILFIFTGDLFPTMMRTQAYGACSFIARFGSILVPYILFLGTTVNGVLPYIIMGAISLLSAVAMFFLPETMGLPIPDTLENARSQDSFRIHFPCSKENRIKNTNVL